MTDWAGKVREGNRRALARLLTLVENETAEADAALAALYPHTGQAHIIGVTGAPGTGKSTLVAVMVRAYRARGQTVGVLAVDPTSPFSGGALLGDRVRMGALSGDRGVFIRSMATRGSLGGLAHTTKDAICVLDAAGFDIILVETVGAGQSEVDIMRAAHTTVVVEAPGLGDGIQAIKAGILEIADVLVVNKADLPGAANTARSLRMMLDLGHPTKTAATGHHGLAASETEALTEPTLWAPPIVETQATDGTGIDTLLASIDAHFTYISETDILIQQEREAAADDLAGRLAAALLAEFTADNTLLDRLAARVASREISPAQAVRDALRTRYDKLPNRGEQHDE